jgi:hypothetical protein
MSKTTSQPGRARPTKTTPSAPQPSSGPVTLTLKFTRTESKQIRRVKEWEERSAAKTLPLTG